MKTTPKNIAVFGSPRSRKHTDAGKSLIMALLADGYHVRAEEEYLKAMEFPEKRVGDVIAVTDIPPETDIVVSVGGDGTLLRAAEWVGDRQIPILGLNSGHLGFLSTYSPEEIPELIRDISDGTLATEQRSVLRVTASGMPEGFWPYALNEVSLLKEDTSSMINIRTEIDGFFLTDYLADGLVVSTPTGSTGYNLSLGGPILQPGLECWIMSPIAPHTLTMRPLAVSSSSIITTVTTSRANSYRVSLDGRSFTMPCGTKLEISHAGFNIYIMRRPGDNFASTLRKKLHWGKR